MARPHRDVGARNKIVRNITIFCACLVVLVMLLERGMITDNPPQPKSPFSTLRLPPRPPTLPLDDSSSSVYIPSEESSDESEENEENERNKDAGGITISTTLNGHDRENSPTTAQTDPRPPAKTDFPPPSQSENGNPPPSSQIDPRPPVAHETTISTTTNSQNNPFETDPAKTDPPQKDPLPNHPPGHVINTDPNVINPNQPQDPLIGNPPPANDSVNPNTKNDEKEYIDESDDGEVTPVGITEGKVATDPNASESPNSESPNSANPTTDPVQDEKQKKKAKENAEKEMLERKVRKEYEDEISGLPSNITFPNYSGSMLLPRPLLFLHIPKTAGSTLAQVFKSNSPKGKYYHFWNHPRLNDLPLVPDLEVIFGHFRYGLHFYMPNQKASYATMLREPVERVISYYHFHLQDPQDPAHDFATKHTFEEWLEVSQAAQNEMTKCLSGVRSEFYPSEKSFEMAKHHLRNMGYVGLTERFDESLELMKYYFGFSDLSYDKAKVGVKKPLEISPELREKIREKNRMDIELYEMAKEIFEEELAKLASVAKNV